MLKYLIIVLIATCVIAQQCPLGYSLEPRIGFKTPINGCGPQSSKLSGILNLVVKQFQPSFISCCNTHDKCYADCTRSQQNCDLAFKHCLLSKCTSEPCRLAANAMYQAVNLFGESAFNQAKKEACVCVRRPLISVDDLYKFMSYGVQEEEEMVEDDVGALEYNVEGAEDDDNTLGYVDDLPSFLETVTQ